MAKGMERTDSDPDEMAVVSQEEVEYWEKHNEQTDADSLLGGYIARRK